MSYDCCAKQEKETELATPAFGRTWWGEQWLNALTHIDYDNRLPRGRSYANKGAVRDLGVSGGIIRAKVKGSQASPYRVTIDVPAMTAADAERLLNREFDPAAAQTKAVKAIPARCFIAMSGTPVENRFSEYWSIMDFANRGYLGTLPHFVREFATPIQVERFLELIDEVYANHGKALVFTQFHFSLGKRNSWGSSLRANASVRLSPFLQAIP